MSEPDTHASPLTELLSLALPTMAQMASYTVMQFIDTWMLSRLGEAPATAAANSGILSFALVSLGIGTLVLVNTFVSQAFGRGEFKKCGQYLWQGIWLSLAYGLALLPMRAVAGPLFAAFGHPAAQALMEAGYFRIVLFSAGVKLVSSAAGQFFLGIDRANAVLAGAVFGVAVNAGAAWCIVLGHCGFASHGVVGAAWAQNIGVTSEMFVLLLLLARRSIRTGFGLFNVRPRWALAGPLLRVGIPSGLQWFSDVLSWSIFCNGVLGLLGSAAMAANTFMLRYMVVSFLPAYGISVAVTALVGRYIGRGRPDIAARRAGLGMIVTMIYILCCGTVFVAFRIPLMRVFTHDPQVISIGAVYLVFCAVYEISDGLYLLYSGALRGAGDTLVPTLVSSGLCWTIMLGGGFLVASKYPGWIAGPWIVACVYGFTLGLWMMWRFVRGPWRNFRISAAV